MNTYWETVERPGYFGSHRAEKHADFDKRFGVGKWRLVWDVKNHVFNREQMTMLYEDAYYQFLFQHSDVLTELLRTASDVYDDALTNMKAGFDYSHQETERTHVQDIAIRRVVSRLGCVFAGMEPLQIRDALGNHPLSLTLSPGRVPFHRPLILLEPEIDGWWLPGSVESFYQSNKLLQRRVDNSPTQSGTTFDHTAQTSPFSKVAVMTGYPLDEAEKAAVIKALPKTSEDTNKTLNSPWPGDQRGKTT